MRSPRRKSSSAALTSLGPFHWQPMAGPVEHDVAFQIGDVLVDTVRGQAP
jgi:hypothetical protein